MPASKHQAMPNGACVKFFLVMFGQTAEYSRLRASHFSAPRSVLGLMASTGHSGSHTPHCPTRSTRVRAPLRWLPRRLWLESRLFRST
jgi:hypothetical protein